MTAAVLDASALLALLLGESDGEKLRAVLTNSAMTAVNLGEVVGHFARIGSAEADIRLMLDPCHSSASRSTRSSPSSQG